MNKTVAVMIIFISMLFLIFVGAGFFIMWNKLAAMSPQTSDTDPVIETEPETPVVNDIGPLLELKPFIVNLADPGGKRYLRVVMQLELDEEKIKAIIHKRLPQIRDAVLMILPTRTIADVQTTEGKMALRTEIIRKINEIIQPGAVTQLYFTEFVIQ